MLRCRYRDDGCQRVLIVDDHAPWPAPPSPITSPEDPVAWLAEEGEIPANSMAKIKRPIVPEQPVRIAPEEGLKRLFAACAS